MNLKMTEMRGSGKTCIEVKNFDLAKTLQCGQCFRWHKNRDGSYTGVVQGRLIEVCQKENQLIVNTASREEVEGLWMSYFDLERDYGAMDKQIVKQAPWMKKAVDLGKGIRILKQDPWETTITFILSANNHIPRITASVGCLAKNWGEYLGTGERGLFYAFPGPEVLQKLNLSDWQQCGAGYRAAYLLKTSTQWKAVHDEMMKAEGSSVEVPGYHRRILEKLPGVGPKVSACISLYGWGHHSQFPVDVWIRRRVKALWPEAPETDREIEQAAQGLFGNAAGYAQQLLFYEARVKKGSIL